MAEPIHIKFCTLNPRLDVGHISKGVQTVTAVLVGVGWKGCKFSLFPLTLALASNTVYCATVSTRDIYDIFYAVKTASSLVFCRLEES